MKVFVPTNKILGHLSLIVPSKFSLCFKFCMFFSKVSHSKASCCGVSKWRFFICQSIWGLCKTNQDNPMMIGFLKDEMTLKTTLLVWKPMVNLPSNGLVSYVTSERFRPSMTSTGPGVLLSIKANLYCYTTSMSIKYVNALKSRSVWVSMVQIYYIW